MHSLKQEERERGEKRERERDTTAGVKVKLNMLRLNPMVPCSKVSIVRSL